MYRLVFNLVVTASEYILQDHLYTFNDRIRDGEL